MSEPKSCSPAWPPSGRAPHPRPSSGRQVTALQINGLVNLLKARLSSQSGERNSRLPNLKARFELRITLPIWASHLISYSLSGVPSCRCSATTCPAILPPIIAIVMPAPLEGRTMPAASPTRRCLPLTRGRMEPDIGREPAPL